jgi:hypothetical protein
LSSWLQANPITVRLLGRALAGLAASSMLKHVVAFFVTK